MPTATIDLEHGTVGHPLLPAATDQTSGAQGFTSWCDISASWSRAQSFTAGRSGTLTTAQVTTFQEGKPNGGLVVSIYRAAPGGTPTGAALSTQNVDASAIGWSPRNITWHPNIPVIAGARYAIGLAAPAVTDTGCYGWEFNNANPYPAGVESFRYNRAVRTIEASRDLKFLTVVQ